MNWTKWRQFSANMNWDKRYLLIIIALLCIGLYFYGSTLSQDNPFLKSLPTIGGLAFGLNTLIQIAH